MRPRFREVTVALWAFCLFLIPAGSSAGPFGLPNLGGKIPGIGNIPKVGNIPNVPNLGKLQRFANSSQFLQQYVVPNLVNANGTPISNTMLNNRYAPRPGVGYYGPYGYTPAQELAPFGAPRSVRTLSTASNNPTIPSLTPAANTAPSVPVDPTAPAAPAVAAPVAPTPLRPETGSTLEDVESAVEFAGRGETEFRNGNYKAAARMFRHALLDSPQNGVLLLMLSQAQFAQGQLTESAVTIYDAMEMLPEEHWGVVVASYQTLYGNPQHYTDQLRVLEKRLKDRGDDPVMRFLVGYHYGYIGYPKNAVQELDKVLPVLPDDQLSARLRNLMAAKAGLPPAEKVVSSPGE